MKDEFFKINLAIKTLQNKNRSLFSEEFQGGTGFYQDPEFGELDFLWDNNKSKLLIQFYHAEFICFCEDQIMCDCDFENFVNGEEYEWEWRLTKAQVKKLLNTNYQYNLL